jgi:hypothetical protein
MLFRKFVVAVAAGALITSFSLAPIAPAYAAKKAKRAKMAKVQPAPKPAVACLVGLVFLPIAILTKKPVC